MTGSIAAQKRSVSRQPQPAESDFAEFRARLPFAPPVSVAACDALPSGDIDALVETAADRSSVSPDLIRSVMRQESAFRPCAVSPKGAIGLMQLMPGTAGRLGVTDSFDLQQNVFGGAKLLRELMDRYEGNLRMTLSAYNAGVRPVDAAAGIPKIPETIDYVNRILARLAGSGSNARPADAHSGRESAPATILPITGSDGGK
jgi:soluble lytic murein transglycosylase-like protein